MKEFLKDFSPIPLTEEQLDKMDTVYSCLEEKNKVMNLTAITDSEEAAERHFADSLYVLTTGLVKGKVLDVGSGGGFPAFPVAIASGLDVTCLDATAKKLDFIKETAEKIKSENISVLCGRAEELSHNAVYREKFDTVLSRGVAKLNILCEWCMPYVKPNGYFIAMKGLSGIEEAEEAKNAFSVLGGEITDIIKYDLRNSGHTHTLVIIKKIKPTDKKYPRPNAQIQKRSL